MKIMANLPLTRRCDEDLSTQRFLQLCVCVCVCEHTVLATLERKKQLKFFNENLIVFLLFFEKIVHDILGNFIELNKFVDS